MAKKDESVQALNALMIEARAERDDALAQLAAIKERQGDEWRAAVETLALAYDLDATGGADTVVRTLVAHVTTSARIQAKALAAGNKAALRTILDQAMHRLKDPDMRSTERAAILTEAVNKVLASW